MAESKPKSTSTPKPKSTTTTTTKTSSSKSSSTDFLNQFGGQFKDVSKPMLETFINNLKMFSDSISTVEKNFDDLSKNAGPLFSYLNDKSGKNIMHYIYKPFLEQLKTGVDTLVNEIKKFV